MPRLTPGRPADAGAHRRDQVSRDAERSIEHRGDGSIVMRERASLGVMLTPHDDRLIVSLAAGPHPFDAVAVTINSTALLALAAQVRARRHPGDT